MDFDLPLSKSEWERTPQQVKDYILALQATIQKLQAELNKYLPSPAEGDADFLNFNGLTDYLVTPYPLDVSPKEFTFEARIHVRRNRAGEFKIVHMYGPDQRDTNWVKGPPRNVGWLSYQWGGVWWGVIDRTGVFHAIHSGPARSGDVNPPLSYMDNIDSVPVDAWHHIAGTWDGEIMKLYMNGEIVNTAPFIGQVTLSTRAYIGAHFGGTHQFFPGRLDDVRIWNRALTSQEVTFHRDGGMIDDDENLVINYSSRYRLAPVLEGRMLPEGSPLRGEDSCSEQLRMLEAQIEDAPGGMDSLPPSQSRLIQELTEHLLDLERRRRGK